MLGPAAKSPESELAQAAENSNSYEWEQAAELYRQALDKIESEKDPSQVSAEGLSKRAEILELSGWALYKAAMQASNAEEFGNKIRQAIEKCTNALQYFERLTDTGSGFRCKALTAYIESWLVPDAAEKKTFLDRSKNLADEALQFFAAKGQRHEFGKTFNQLEKAYGLSFALESNPQSREATVRKAIEHGERAVEYLSGAENSPELASALVAAAGYLGTFGFLFLDPQEREKYYVKARAYWQKAVQISEQTALLEISSFVPVEGVDFTDWNTETVLRNLDRALELARKTKDKFRIGFCLDWLAGVTFLRAWSLEDPEHKLRVAESALGYANEARRQRFSIRFKSPRADAFWVDAPEAEYYWGLALWETDLTKKRNHLKKALEASAEGTTKAEKSGFPSVISLAHHVFAKVLLSQARLTQNSEERKRLLVEALEHRSLCIEITDEVVPHNYWARGAMRNYLADLKSELAELAQGPKDKARILRESVLEKETSLSLCQEYLASKQSPPLADFVSLGRWQYELGILLGRLYKCTEDTATLKRATEAFANAVKSFERPNLSGRLAECYWKAALSYSSLDDHAKANSNFLSASNNYRAAAGKMPQLKSLYEDLALYMEAWAFIEEARQRHNEENYPLAAQSYEKANYILQTTKAWNHLSKHYAACYCVENAEGQSMRERQEESILSFNRAAELFQDAAEKLETKSTLSQDPLEKQELTDWLRITVGRKRYCIAKRLLEEAKQLDKKDEKDKSLERYREASSAFRALLAEMESDQNREELEILALFCEAWSKMKEAEIHASPEIYADAAKLFAQVEKKATNQKFQHLALANSYICNALASGSRFRQTRNTQLYARIKSLLETAGDYYEQAGFEKAAGWTRAMQKFFDALVYLADAETEREPNKKAELYHLAEKSVDLASRLYAKAGFPGKEAEARKILRRAREEKELLQIPSEALANNPIAFQTSVAPPSLLRDQATGLEKYDSPQIIGRVKVEEKKHYLGSTVNIELEMTNAGKTGTALVRVEHVAPEGLEIDTKQLPYQSQGNSIEMKGRRLEPLKSFTVKIPLKAIRKGVFEARPSVVAVDERGNQGSYEFEPSVIVLQDPGLPENLQATTADRLATREIVAPMSWFETEQGRSVFQHLVKLFLKDYMSKGVPVDQSGWRSLMDLVRDLELPRSAFYGAEGRDGRVLSELDRRGLIERRIFQEQRGRGGAITRVRVAYDTTTVRAFVKKAFIESL